MTVKAQSAMACPMQQIEQNSCFSMDVGEGNSFAGGNGYLRNTMNIKTPFSLFESHGGQA